MWQRNNGQGEAAILQNQFTAYVVTAVKRQKIQYLHIKSKNLKREIPLDMQEERREFQFEQDMILHLPFLEQLENNNLSRALVQLNEREILILARRIFDERSFQEIADEIGLGYKTVASIYYRLLQKLRKELGGEEK